MSFLYGMSTEFSPQHTSSAMLVCLSLAVQPAGVCVVCTYVTIFEFHLGRRPVMKKERKRK
jgi:hypothetical protein